jgi:hypothetical protein
MKVSICGEADCPTPYEFCEACIRADERATIKYEMGVLQWEGLRLRQERADLRAKVAALPPWIGAGGKWLSRDAVLALIDGGET